MISLKTGNGMDPKTSAGKSRLSDADLALLVPPRGGREVKVGLFVLIGVLATLLALFTLTDAGTFRGRYYATTVVQNAGGLRKGDPVQMRGVNVGRVNGFRIEKDGVVVRLELEGEYRVPKDSRVAFRSSGLLGGLTAEIVPGASDAELKNGDVLPGEGASATDVMAQASELGSQADTVLNRVQALLSQQTIGAVGQSAQDLQSTLAQLAALATEQRAQLATLSASLQRSATGVERATNGPELKRAVARMDSITLQLDQTVATLNRSSGSLETVLGRMERGEGTLGKLSRDESLYNNANEAAANTNALIADIRANPKKYLSVSVF